MSDLNAMLFSEKDNNTKDLLNRGLYPIIGSSRAISRVRDQVGFSANMSFPIFISGEIGTEKYSVAKTIHNKRGLEKKPFTHVCSNMHDVESYKKILEKSIENSQGGTLYLSEVDLLPDDLKDYLISFFVEEKVSHQLFKNDINLLISCTNSLISNNSSPQYIASIFGCSVPHLEIQIPPLRERKEDLQAHVNYILQNILLSRRLSLDSDAMDLFLSYHWPENLDQLQRVLYLLASYCEHNITLEDVAALNLFEKEKEEPDVIELILSQDMEHFKHVHPGLKKALAYIGENFKEDITVSSLSNVACTSASHLSFLFRNHLGLSFKSILVQVRVRYAKKLIETSPQMKITDISLQAGFGDLSHFEKMFKRYVGCTPRQYRQKLRLDKKISITV
ncbi:HTH-type transcriptional activator Btr [Marinomonas spartinae]|uniref:AraC family transcriptional regulator n=1 Tax=Marinomonas spartinae TaxID=1792290 RepID=UPI000808C4FA|nr:AraC family transcriptional regulator [Marinomonas spartinae]SBS31141.1 HTH-type transcriptional activator Btr [Marinomonas spartinae]